MKKYTKPTIEWTEMDNTVLLAGSKPGISGETAGSGVEACSLGEEDAPIVFGMDGNPDGDGGYWGM